MPCTLPPGTQARGNAGSVITVSLWGPHRGQTQQEVSVGSD